MQGFRKYTLVVSLDVALTTIAATNGVSSTRHQVRGLDESFITQLLKFFGIDPSASSGEVDESRYSIPPG
jgi:hypothetical protein